MPIKLKKVCRFIYSEIIRVMSVLELYDIVACILRIRYFLDLVPTLDEASNYYLSFKF
jgi:hypothetical protein